MAAVEVNHLFSGERNQDGNLRALVYAIDSKAKMLEARVGIEFASNSDSLQLADVIIRRLRPRRTFGGFLVQNRVQGGQRFWRLKRLLARSTRYNRMLRDVH